MSSPLDFASRASVEVISAMLENVRATFTTQIEIDEQGVARIAGTNIKVVEVVMDRLAHGWSPEEIHFQHPHLSLAQIHGALTFYYENHTDLDRQMAQSEREALELAAKVSDQALRQRLTEWKQSHRS